MPSRKDQLHSYQFLMQRVVSSVMVHETDPEQAPLRRGVGAVFVGVMLTGLVSIGFAVYGVISGNVGDRWQSPGAIVIERETGAHYVYQDGVLQPVLNYTSARLVAASTPQAPEQQNGLLGGLLGGAGSDSEPQRVASGNLAGIPRSVTVGIPGAPDSLPPPDQAAGPPWTMCSVLGEDSAGSPVTTTALLAGGRVPGGAPFEDRGMLVRDSEDGTTYLLWRSHRYQLTGEDPGRVIRSLYGFQEPVVAAGSAWLNGLPSGQEIGPIEIRGQGESSAVSGHDIGEVIFHPVAGGEQYYLVRDDGLAHLTELQMLLLRGQYAVEPGEVPAAVVAAAPSTDALAPAGGEAAPPPAPPELLPVPETGEVVLCAETADARSAPRLSFGGDLAATRAAIPTGAESPEGARLADSVLVPPGRIAVVRAMPSDTATTGSYHLVTDLGLRYPVPNVETLEMLGYSPAQAVDLPAALVRRVPAGPTLSAGAARQPAPVPPG